MWKQKYLGREASCRVYCLPSGQLHPDMLRPARAYPAPGTTKENLDKSAANAVDDALSFVQHNEAIYQFVQWFATESAADVQVPAVLGSPMCGGLPYWGRRCAGACHVGDADVLVPAMPCWRRPC